ncbi:hypothetical protein COTS27_00312 [Spirochaetota bacterium]|nr:hypothetical protein COTS27_00312 [Spirochaetota bacterium]
MLAMNKHINVTIIIEGETEQRFVDEILYPYLEKNNVYVTATMVNTGNKNINGRGGDVRFNRVVKKIRKLLNDPNIYVSTMVDYYGVKEWPAIKPNNLVSRSATPDQIKDIIYQETIKEIKKTFPKPSDYQRFIPYISIHEFEMLLFSDSSKLAEGLEVAENEITKILLQFGNNPEKINNDPTTAPSKRLDHLYATKFPNTLTKFLKTTKGVTIAASIGIDVMRQKCSIFNEWITKLEGL